MQEDQLINGTCCRPYSVPPTPELRLQTRMIRRCTSETLETPGSTGQGSTALRSLKKASAPSLEALGLSETWVVQGG